MPSQKTLYEAYWQYTKQRENETMADYAKEMQAVISKEPWYIEYSSASFLLKRASRLQLLGSMITAKMRHL